MKTFWSIIAVLAILTAGLLIASRDKQLSSEAANASVEALPQHVLRSPSDTDEPAETRVPNESTDAPKELNLTPDEIAAPPRASRDTPAQDPDRFRAPPPQAGQPSESDAEAAALTPNAPAEITILRQVGDKPPDEDLEALVKTLQDSPEIVDDQAHRLPSPAADGSENASPTTTAATPGLAPSSASTTMGKREDGSYAVDSQFTVRGKGTQIDPYQVPWEMLVATSQVYDPAADKLELPERIRMLDGKIVRVVGFIAFPVDAASPEQALVMRHAWDGCCVGVRPTAYDAVRVQLDAAPTAEQMLMDWGSVTGRFKMQPQTSSDGLLSLYSMDNAALTKENR